MKKYIITTLVLLFAVSFWNCEKDDICADETPTTPSVVLEFFDSASGDKIKTVSLKYRETTTGISDTKVGVSTLKIPLRTDADTVTFELILNGNTPAITDDTTDVITLNYTRTETYVSRACGYKTTFVLNQNNGYTNTNNWIFATGILNNNISNEKPHIRIFH
jgi:hypothetical protein